MSRGHLPQIFKGRRERSGCPEDQGTLPAVQPYLRASRFQGCRCFARDRPPAPNIFYVLKTDRRSVDCQRGKRTLPRAPVGVSGLVYVTVVRPPFPSREEERGGLAFGRDFQRWNTCRFGVLVDEVFNKQGYVERSLPKWRHIKLNDIQSPVQVLTKVPCLNLLFQISIGRNNCPNIYLSLMFSADSSYGSIL
jgi:hypothetical protein